MANTDSTDKRMAKPYSPPTISVTYTDERFRGRAAQIASDLTLPLCRSDTVIDDQETPSGYQLRVSENGLAMVACDQSHGPVSIDFVTGKNAHRRQFGGGRGQPLSRALGIGKLPSNTVIDATAGLGGDAFVMASLGLKVTLLEQSSILTTLLNEAIKSSAAVQTVSDVTKRMTVINTNAITWLDQHNHPVADVIYLDPMYPARGKSAQVKKGMQLLHSLIGPDMQGDKLLTSAIKKAGQRVVVKRPAGAKPLLPDAPHLPQRNEIRSPNTRYDIYRINP